MPLTPGVRPTAVVAPTFASCSATRYPAKLSEKSEKEPMEVSTVHVPSRAEPVAAPEPGDAAAGADGDADEAGEGDPDEVEAVEAGEAVATATARGPDDAPIVPDSPSSETAAGTDWPSM